MEIKEINILHLEDEVMDAYLVKKILERAMLKFQVNVICDKEAFISALHTGKYDIILADHSMPQFTAMDALHIMKEKNIDLPFILVTGTVSEEYSVNAMKEGAWDYILKDRLQRLPSAVTSSLERYEASLDKKKHIKEIIAKEALMKEAERLAHFGSWQADLVNGNSTWSDEKYRILGYEPGEVAASFENFMARVHPDDIAGVKQIHEHAFGNLNSLKYECRIVTNANETKYIHAELVIKRDTGYNITALTGFVHDVTESKAAELKLEESELKYKYLFTHSPQPAWVFDAETYCFLDVNEAAIKYYGYTYDEFRAMTAFDIRPNDERTQFEKSIIEDIKNNTTHKSTWRHIKKDGSLVNADVLSANVMYDGRPARLVLLTNLTSGVGASAVSVI